LACLRVRFFLSYLVESNPMLFQSLNLHASIVQALTASGYTEPTPVQEKSIPEAIAGHDLMCSAPTGTGKTAAFVLPALQRLLQPARPGRGPRVLVLTPTRELALQVTAAVSKYSKFMQRVRTGTVLGGMPYPQQRRLLDSPLDILVATPGRLIDFIDQGKVDFSRLEMLVLDEADRMLDMGFIQPVEKIAAAAPAARQTLLFSATLDGGIATLAKRLLKQPKLIQCVAEKASHSNIEQRLHYVDDGGHKHRLLDHLLRDADLTQAIVFTATKRGADRLSETLNDKGHASAPLHGNMNQSQRNRTLARVRSGNVRVLVATDVAARGIDVSGITHVFNYDLPKVAEDYVHRIGRTGRAGASGIAISFAAPDDGHQVKQIERYTGHQIERHVIEGMEPKVKPRSGAPSGARRPRFGEQRKRPGVSTQPRRFGNNESRWGAKKPSGGARPARDFGTRGPR
jgi:superfamily II DNA/RNA helicase